MASLNFELVSPESVLYFGKASMVLLPAANGELGVLPGHAPVVTKLNSGIITVFNEHNEVQERIFVAGGFANISETGCTAMADEGINVKDIHPDELETYIADMYAKMDAELDKEEIENIEKSVMIAKAKIDLFRKLKDISKIK